MEVNGFQLPAAFVQHCEAIRKRKFGSIWVHRNDMDAYGRPWEMRDLTIIGDVESIREDTDFLAQAFRQGGFQQNTMAHDKPGFVLDFTDVSKLVWFGRTGSGEPYCFDFREAREEPSILFWHYDYWRRVAPNFESLIALFQPIDEAEPHEPSEEEWEEAMSIPRTPYEVLAPLWAESTPEERRELEEEVRKEMESQEFGDEERRAMEQVLERLRFSAAS